MKLVSFLLPIGLLFMEINIFAQSALNGLVVSSENYVGLPYATIGVKGKERGTITDNSGNFSLFISDQNLHDSLVFSYVGFENRTIAVADMMKEKELIISMKPMAFELSTVEVKGKQNWKYQKIGVTRFFGSWFGYAENNMDQLLFEYAQVMDAGAEKVQLQSLNFYVPDEEDRGFTFRVFFYNLENGKPGSRFIEKDILLNQTVQKGWNELDVSEHNIWINGAFAVGLQFYKVEKYAGRFFTFLGGNMAAKKVGSFYRRSHLDIWNEEKSGPYAIYISTRYLR